MIRLLPRSLTGQIGLLVAVALFVAQAINFALLLQERSAARFGQVVVPAVTRLADAAERISAAPATAPFPAPPRPRLHEHRGRIQVTPDNPIPADAGRRPDLEREILRALNDSGVHPGAVVAAIRPFDDHAPPPPGVTPERAERMRRLGAELRIAVALPGRGWLSLTAPWPRYERGVVWQLLGQTLILYAVVLIPLLLAGRRIALPLRRLATAARSFRPGEPPEPVAERGPADVRAVIAAYNALGLRVNAMLDEKDRMLGAIGHDLRTPLAALRVRVESVEDEDDRARMADTIDEMNRTLEDILSLARLGRPSEPPTEVDLPALIDAVVEDFRDLGAEVSFEESPRLRARLRPSLMRRAVRNLIENAVKYGHGAAVRLIADDRRLTIEVSDHGPGIPEDQLAAVFDPFTRLETSRNRETGGAGLGLALARAIVREAGGEIGLANRPEGGLRATITLPRRG